MQFNRDLLLATLGDDDMEGKEKMKATIRAWDRRKEGSAEIEVYPFQNKLGTRQFY